LRKATGHGRCNGGSMEERAVIQKKVLVVCRDTGEELYSYEAGSGDMPEDRYYKPFVDLYEESIQKLEQEGGWTWAGRCSQP